MDDDTTRVAPAGSAGEQAVGQRRLGQRRRRRRPSPRPWPSPPSTAPGRGLGLPQLASHSGGASAGPSARRAPATPATASAAEQRRVAADERRRLPLRVGPPAPRVDHQDAAPRSMADDRNPLTTLDTQRSPSRTHDLGQVVASANRVRAQDAVGRRRRRRRPDARSPERGSARTGQPRASARAEHRVRAGRTRPRPRSAPRRPGSEHARTPPGDRIRRPRAVPAATATSMPGRPVRRARAPTPPPAAGSPSSGSRKGRLRWTGPGTARPRVASATDRAASDRHVTGRPRRARPDRRTTGRTARRGGSGRWSGAPRRRAARAGGRPCRRCSGTRARSASTTAACSSAAAVPLVVTHHGRAARGQPDPEGGEPGRALVQPDVDGQAGWAARATASGVDRDPGHTTAWDTPPRTHSSTRVAANAAWTSPSPGRAGPGRYAHRSAPCRRRAHPDPAAAAARPPPPALHAETRGDGPARW